MFCPIFFYVNMKFWGSGTCWCTKIFFRLGWALLGPFLGSSWSNSHFTKNIKKQEWCKILCHHWCHLTPFFAQEQNPPQKGHCDPFLFFKKKTLFYFTLDAKKLLNFNAKIIFNKYRIQNLWIQKNLQASLA